MSEGKMPVAEVAVADEREFNSYELAFHVLPTVAEGEVSGVFDTIKTLITKDGAEIFDEEAPERFNLAYEIVKHIDGRNRKFSSAYFGWVRFKAEASMLAELTEEIDLDANILRYIVIKLTKVEEENPFRFHEAIASEKRVTDVAESTVVPDVTTVESSEEEKDESADSAETEEAEVSETKLDEALEKEETDTK